MRLQKSPLGLLGAFELKVSGQNPPEFSDTVVPVVDAYDQYLALNQRVVRQQRTITNPGTFNSNVFAVPAGKVWRVWGTSYAAVLDVADAALTVLIDWRVSADANGTFVWLMPFSGRPELGGAGNRQLKASALFGRPVLLPPGWIVNSTTQLSAAPAVSFTWDAALLVQEFDA